MYFSYNLITVLAHVEQKYMEWYENRTDVSGVSVG